MDLGPLFFNNRDRIYEFVHGINNREIALIRNTLHDDIILDLFSVLEAKTIYIQGKENVCNSLSNSFNQTDVRITINELFISNNNRILAELLYEGTYWNYEGGFKIDEPFIDKNYYTFDFKNGKIWKMNAYRDSFKILQLVGRAALKSNNEQMISSYIEKLNDLDLLSDKWKKETIS